MSFEDDQKQIEDVNPPISMREIEASIRHTYSLLGSFVADDTILAEFHMNDPDPHLMQINRAAHTLFDNSIKIQSLKLDEAKQAIKWLSDCVSSFLDRELHWLSDGYRRIEQRED